MSLTQRRRRDLALSLAVAAGMTGFFVYGQANHYSAKNIRDAQHLLKDDGYYSGPVDGVSGPLTKRAIRQYQRANNMTVDGMLDDQTRNQLGMLKAGEADRAQRQLEQKGSTAAKQRPR